METPNLDKLEETLTEDIENNSEAFIRGIYKLARAIIRAIKKDLKDK